LEEALEVARQLHCPPLVIGTESAAQPLGQSRKLADALGARYIALENLAESEEWVIAPQQSARNLPPNHPVPGGKQSQLL
jgi:magnesium chelatase subunit D